MTALETDERDIIAYAVGIVSMSACAKVTVSIEEVERHANQEYPTGISSRWEVALDESHFADGTPHPCPCDKAPDVRRHYLLHC